MSRNPSGRSWYRLSSMVRPTPHSSRDPSPPRRAIEQPPSPPSPPSPRSPPKEVKEAKPSPVAPPRFIRREPRHEHETTRNMLTSSDKTNLVHGPNKEQQQQKQQESSSPRFPKEAKQSPVRSPRFINHEPTTPKPRHERETTTRHKNILTSSDKSHKTNKEQQQQQLQESSSPRFPKEIKEAKTSSVPSPQSIKHDPRSSKSPPKEVKEAKPSPVLSLWSIKHDPRSSTSPPKEVKEARHSPVPSPRSIKHDPKSTHEPPKPKHEHETKTTRHHTNILTSSEKTTFSLHKPNHKQQQDSNMSSSSESDDDFIIGTPGAITISANNKGAVMEILGSLRKTHGALKEEKEKSTSKSKTKTKKYNNNDENLPMNSYVNSNVQMINGSVVYNSMDTHHDPGVHLSLYRSFGNGFIIKDHGDGYTSSIN